MRDSPEEIILYQHHQLRACDSRIEKLSRALANAVEGSVYDGCFCVGCGVSYREGGVSHPDNGNPCWVPDAIAVTGASPFPDTGTELA